MTQRYVSDAYTLGGTLEWPRRCVTDIATFPCSPVLANPQNFHQMAVTWKHLKHPNIVPLLGVTTNPLQHISDWMPGGDLTGYISSHPDADRLYLVGARPAVHFTTRLPPH